MEGNGFDYLVKVLMIGDSGVGKTCLLQKFENGQFTMNHLPTIAIDFSIKTIVVRGKRMKIQIWDTAGQERYNTLTTGFFKSTQCILLCFALTDRVSFESVHRWMTQINTLSPKDVLVILVGNKSDLAQERKISEEEARALAQNFCIDYFETSAVSGENINELFVAAGEKLLTALETVPTADGQALVGDGPRQKKNCCG